jgi:hypothetical protein
VGHSLNTLVIAISSMNYKLCVALAVIGVLIIPVYGGTLMSVPKAYAINYTINDQASCESTAESFGGSATWNSIAFGGSCTIETSITIPEGDSLTVEGIHLFVASSASITNNGELNTEDSAVIEITGSKLSNIGTINLSNGGTLQNTGGTLENLGTINIATSGNGSLFNSNGGTITNSGEINVEPTLGFSSGSLGNFDGTFNNNGEIHVNAGSLTNFDGGTFNNNAGGTIDVTNSGGLFNNIGSVAFSNDGTIHVDCTSVVEQGTTWSGNQPIDSCDSDTEAPQVTFNVQDKKGRVISDGSTTNSKDIIIEFTATDNVGVTSVECSLGGPGTTFDKQFSPCTSPIELSKLAKGTYTFTVVATDEAENEGTYTFKWIVKQP